MSKTFAACFAHEFFAPSTTECLYMPIYEYGSTLYVEMSWKNWLAIIFH